MPRSLDDWIDDWHKKLQKVHGNIDRAKAEEGVRSVRNLQSTAPKPGKWPRIGSQKARGYKILHNSIKLDFETGETWTDHPSKEFLDKGGTIRPKRKRWLTVRLRAGWMPGKGGFVAIRARSGNLVIVHEKRRGAGVYGLMLKKAVVRGNRWIERGHAMTVAGSDERIADKALVLP